MNKTTEALKVAEIEDLQDSVTKALKKAFQLGQTYWQQADSESFSQNKKADETQAKFYELEDETVAAIREALDHSGDANEMVMDWSKVKPEAIKSDPMYQMGYAAAKAEPVKQEPVAWVDAKEEGYEFYGISYLPVGKHHLYAAPVDAKAIRAEALEEAAKVCEAKIKQWIVNDFQNRYNYAYVDCVAAIRGLK